MSDKTDSPEKGRDIINLDTKKFKKKEKPKEDSAEQRDPGRPSYTGSSGGFHGED